MCFRLGDESYLGPNGGEEGLGQIRDSLGEKTGETWTCY